MNASRYHKLLNPLKLNILRNINVGLYKIQIIQYTKYIKVELEVPKNTKKQKKNSQKAIKKKKKKSNIQKCVFSSVLVYLHN